MTHDNQTAQAARLGSPWPPPAALWPDPPWRLEGAIATVWFYSDAARVRSLLGPDMAPIGREQGVRTRLRFYDVSWVAVDSDSSATKRAGQFREAVVAYEAQCAGHTGEFSAFMWTDDDVYRSWGREAFGWPLVPGEIAVDGLAGEAAGSTLRIAGSGFEASMRIGELADVEDTPQLGETPVWLTPRRIVVPGSPISETRQLLVVRPELLAAGKMRAGRATVEIAASAPHPLGPTGWVDDLRVEVVTDFALLVGRDVRQVDIP